MAVGLAAGAAHAEGTGNDLLPDIPLGAHAVRLEVVADVGPSAVIDITNAGDGSGRLFLVSPGGTIRVLSEGSVQAMPFLDAPADPKERGMSSLAFDPNYASNGKLYLITGEATPNPAIPDYVPPQIDTNSAFDNVLVEYRVDPNDLDRADPSSRRELLRVRQPHRDHKMNDLAFDADGLLYIAMGDGGGTLFGSPEQFQTNAQQTDNPYGTVLRIDVSAVGPNGRYIIPSDNPFFDPNDPAFGLGANVPEIFAWGLRNPWRISVDRLTGKVYTGVNGHRTIEHIVRVETGRNYGWAVKEGSFLWDPISGEATLDPDPDPSFTPPLAEYDHNGTRQAFGSAIGGFVYRGAQIPALYGRYVFLDFVAGELISMDPNSGALELLPVDPNGVQPMIRSGITWGEDEQGELYVGRITGEVLKLVSVVLCGDLDGDRDRDGSDVDLLRAHLANPPAGLSGAALSRCSVIGDASSCDVADLAVLRRVCAGLGPGPGQICEGATAPSG